MKKLLLGALCILASCQSKSTVDQKLLTRNDAWFSQYFADVTPSYWDNCDVCTVTYVYLDKAIVKLWIDNPENTHLINIHKVQADSIAEHINSIALNEVPQQSERSKISKDQLNDITGKYVCVIGYFNNVQAVRYKSGKWVVFVADSALEQLYQLKLKNEKVMERRNCYVSSVNTVTGNNTFYTGNKEMTNNLTGSGSQNIGFYEPELNHPATYVKYNTDMIHAPLYNKKGDIIGYYNRRIGSNIITVGYLLSPIKPHEKDPNR